MIAPVLIIAMLKLVQSGGLRNFPDVRMGCYSALVLAKTSQCPDLFYYEEEKVHKVAHFMRTRGKHFGMGLQRLQVIAEELYIKYLKRMRAEVLNRKSLAILVENMTGKNVREYLPTITQINVLHYTPVTGLLRPLKYVPEDNDDVRQAYYKNALAALNTLASIHHDYQAYTRFPNISERFSLERLEGFIAKNFGRFDFGATYPDIVMCLSSLQYLKYVAMLDGNLAIVDTILGLFDRTVDALENMSFAPLNVLDYKTYKGEVTVAIMPQAVKGPKPVPICINPFRNGTMVQISVLDVKYPNNSKYVYEQLKHLDEFVAIMN